MIGKKLEDKPADAKHNFQLADIPLGTSGGSARFAVWGARGGAETQIVPNAKYVVEVSVAGQTRRLFIDFPGQEDPTQTRVRITQPERESLDQFI